MVAVAVEGQLESDVALAVGVCGIVLIQQGHCGILVVVGVSPHVVLVASDSRGNDVSSRGAGAREDGVADGLTVDGQGDGLAQVHILKQRIGVVDGEVVDGGLVAQQHLLARGDGVAVVRQAIGVLGGGDLCSGNVAEVIVAGLELLIGSLHVLLDVELDGGDLRLVAVVVLETLEVDVLAVHPLAVHHEGAIAHRSGEVGVEILQSHGGHRGQGGVARHIGEVGIGGGELDHEGLVIGRGDAREDVGLAGSQCVIAVHHGDVVGHGRGAVSVGLGIHQTGPATYERLGIHGVAVVELAALLEGEGELGAVVIGSPRLSGGGYELALLVIEVGKAVKHLIANLSALGLLAVVGVDGHGVVDVDLGSSALSACLGGGAVILLAGGQCHESGRSSRTLEERAATDLEELAHTLSFCLSCLFAQNLSGSSESCLRSGPLPSRGKKCPCPPLDPRRSGTCGSTEVFRK